MTATRIEVAIDEMEIDDGGYEELSDDAIRAAWLCAELNGSRTGVRASFDAAWLDR
jgi:hypothetical protein